MVPRLVPSRPPAVLLAAAVALMVATPAAAKDITVNPGTNTIQAKINQASNGDRLLLKPGGYTITQTVRVNKRLTILAQNSNNRPNLYNGGELADWKSLMIVNGPGSGTTIRRLNFTRCERGAAINIRDCADVTVAGCQIKDCGSSGVLMERAGNIEVKNCTVRRCLLKAKAGYKYYIPGWLWGAAVSCLEGSDITVFDNRIYENHGEGILIQGVFNADIIGNYCADNFSVNLYLNHVRNAVVQYNTVTSTWKTAYYRGGEPAFGIGVSNENATPYWTTSDNVLIANNDVLNTRSGVWIPREGWGDYAAVTKTRINNNRFRNVWGNWIVNGWGGNITNRGNDGF